MTNKRDVSNLWNTTHKRIHNHLTTTIDDPQAYDCNVVAYVRGHRQLLIEVNDPTAKEYKPCYIAFESVWYFEGPLSWHGADFRLGSLDERKTLLSEGWFNAGDALPLHEMAERFVPLLFILERSTFRVRILASVCYVTETRPFEIHQIFPDVV